MTTLGRRQTWLTVVVLLAATASGTSAEDAAIPEMETRVFARVNAHRVSIGLPEFAPSRELAESAREHSRAMASGKRGFGHEGFQSRQSRRHRSGNYVSQVSASPRGNREFVDGNFTKGGSANSQDQARNTFIGN